MGGLLINILHVCSYFNTSSLYKNLFESNAKNEIYQEVFIPQYVGQKISPSEYGTVKKKERNRKQITYHYEEILNKADRYFLFYRTKKVYSKMKKSIDIEKNTFLHGHSLYANGGVCLHLKKEYGNNYIVAFRNTDLTIYKKFPIYRNLAKQIILNSNKIIFISYALRERFLNEINDEEMKQFIKKNNKVISNGLTKAWFNENSKNKIEENNKIIKFIYQGTLHKRKNVSYIIKLIEGINRKGYSSTLEIVGGGPEKTNIIHQIEKSLFKKRIILKDWEVQKSKIIKNYQKNDIFIMPSVNETFGISYIEALALGLPIIYKQNDGIDGFFSKEEPVGVALDGKDINKDVDRIISVINNKKKIQKNIPQVVNQFDWENISKQYMDLYVSGTKIHT